MGATTATSTLIRQLLESLGRFAAAHLRRLGAGRVAPDWETRAAVCERCPLRVVRCGVSYCGTPFLQQIDRDPAVDGCGCRCQDKAKSPHEHCPIDSRHQPATMAAGKCSCKWCLNPQSNLAA